MEIVKVAPGVSYIPNFISEPDAALADVLDQVHLVQRSRVMYGRRVETPRMEAWYGDQPYRFGGSSLPAAALPPILESLAVRAECVVQDANFRTCLVNLYRSGADTVGWHSDDEPEMGDPIIASVSLGAERTFKLRRKAEYRHQAQADRLAGAPWATPDNISLELAHGSLLVMHRGVQAEWEHSVPRRARVEGQRVNLTFRDCSAA